MKRIFRSSAVPVPRAAIAVIAVLAALAVEPARAAAPGLDALRAAADADDFMLARIAARVGDDVVLAALADAADPLAQLAAIRAAPFIVDGDQALLPLTTIAAARDPELAPVAAWKLARITQDLVRKGLDLREVLPRSLTPARAAMIALAADATARADIRSCAGRAAHLLASVGVPEREKPATPESAALDRHR